MTIDEMIAEMVAQQLDVPAVLAHIDTKKIGLAIEKQLIASVKDVDWSEFLTDLLYDEDIKKQVSQFVSKALSKP